jgi:hypothetical protein
MYKLMIWKQQRISMPDTDSLLDGESEEGSANDDASWAFGVPERAVDYGRMRNP